MSINRKIVIIAVMGLALGVSSCKKFLNINKNPNVTSGATVQTLLPGAELYIASTVGVDFEINGSIWGEYWTQDPGASQYRSVEQYAPGQDYFSTPWTNLYAAGENLYQLGVLADSLKQKQYKAISLVLKAYTFQLITDAWGDAPYSQALKGLPADSSVINPKYDSQRVIYSGILANIDSGLALIDPSAAVTPGSDDLIYGGNMLEWRKFAYTLKLRVLLRMSAIDPVTAKAGIQAMYTEPNFILIGEGDDGVINFGYSSANKNPLYAEASSTTLAGVQNLVGSKTCIDSMNSNGDPRAYLFYESIASQGEPVGIAQGDYAAVVAAGTFSLPNVYVAGDANDAASSNAPVNLLTSWESLFLQAEVVARGWEATSSGLTDDSLFFYGIKASFDFKYYATGIGATYDSTLTSFGYPSTFTGSPFTDYMTGAWTSSGTPGMWTVYPTGGSQAQKIRFIITQKWFAMCGNQGFEAWCEERRTGYPDFFVVSQASLIGNNYPKRFLYPTSESTRNANFPGVASITTKTWWDIL